MSGEERFGLIRGSSKSPEIRLDRAGYDDPVFVKDEDKPLNEHEIYAEFLQANSKYNDLMGWND
jgi:hypothetical protein